MGSFELSSSFVLDGGCAEEEKKLQSLKRLGFWNLTPLKVKISCTAITSRRATAAFLLSSCPIPSCVMSVMCISSELSCNAASPMPPAPVVCQEDKLINVSLRPKARPVSYSNGNMRLQLPREFVHSWWWWVEGISAPTTHPVPLKRIGC